MCATIFGAKWGWKWGQRARVINKLTDRQVKNLKAPGRYSDGNGLYLNVGPTGSKSWLFLYVHRKTKKRREMGLGASSAVSLRDLASAKQKQIAAGLDPFDERDRQKSSGLTFGQAADALVESLEGEWKNEKHRAQWKMTLKVYCKSIRSRPVDSIGMDDVLRILTPIWNTKRETARRLRGRIERVLDYARVIGAREGENPARWRGHLEVIFQEKRVKQLVRGHHRALPVDALPDFMRRLRAQHNIASRCLEFTVLTATRTSESLGAAWDEISFDKALWTIPAARMKADREHRVPLSSRAIALLQKMEAIRTSHFVFPGLKRGKPLSTGAMDALLERMQVSATVHGFRSTFRDWVGECTSFPTDLAEMALAHVVGSKTEQAYRRGDGLERRRELMEAWASFAYPPEGANVLTFKLENRQ
jgi:integrase